MVIIILHLSEANFVVDYNVHVHYLSVIIFIATCKLPNVYTVIIVGIIVYYNSICRYINMLTL